MIGKIKLKDYAFALVIAAFAVLAFTDDPYAAQPGLRAKKKVKTGPALSAFQTRITNGNRIEINGEKGSLVFAFERMNELEFLSAEDPPHLQGFRTILATEPGEHPYCSAWWPPGHIIGYEHTFINQAADILEAIAQDKPLQPDFADATKTQAVLDAVLKSAEEEKWAGV